MAYPPGSPGLLLALETLMKTALDTAKAEFDNDLAQEVCEGLHDGPAKGLKCRACYEAEKEVPMMLQVQEELEAARSEGKKGNLP